MGELADPGRPRAGPNLWGTVPPVVEMQSEGGAAGALHGALQTGALATTFTASQGLLLMIPNMYKIAGELTPTVFHVAARSLATQALSIFGDHSDVMAARQTGWAHARLGSVQEAQDFAADRPGRHAAARVPFLHFFDGFRTSHEVNKIELLADDDLRALIADELVRAHRGRALSPDHPVMRGTAQNPDVYFQAREARQPVLPGMPGDRPGGDGPPRRADRPPVPACSTTSARPDAERVDRAHGLGRRDGRRRPSSTWLRRGEKVGVVTGAPLPAVLGRAFLAALPPTVRRIAVLDRTKEPGALGEPLYQDVVTALAEAHVSGERAAPCRASSAAATGCPRRSSRPAMVKGVFDELAPRAAQEPLHRRHRRRRHPHQPDYDPDFDIEPPSTSCARSSAAWAPTARSAPTRTRSRSSARRRDYYAQGYFVYDSKKSGSQHGLAPALRARSRSARRT